MELRLSTQSLNAANEAKTPAPRVSERAKNILESSGSVFVKTGIVGSAVFFSAPVLIPVIAGAAVTKFMFKAFVSVPPKDSSVGVTWRQFISEIACSILLGGLAAGLIGCNTWHPIKDFVCDPKVVETVLISGGATTGVGGLLCGLSRCIN